jgi:predicted nucleic acid-binding protein
MKLLDTRFLIHYWGGREEVQGYLEAHDDEEFITTALNIKEIAVGRALQDALSPAEIRSTFEWVRIAPFDVDASFVAGELEAALHRDESTNQDKINALAGDLLIAAVAKQWNATVVTENTDDFESFDGVAVESYL